MPADAPAGFVTLNAIALEVSNALGFKVQKQSVQNRLNKLHLMERCHIDPSINAWVVPPDAASQVSHSLMIDPPKPRGRNAQRSDDSPAAATADDGLMALLQEQADTTRRALDQAEKTAERLQQQNDDLMAELRDLNERLLKAESQAAEYRGNITQLVALVEQLRRDNEAITRDASSMAYASLRQRVLGFRQYRDRLPAPKQDGPRSDD